jgi:hypothetical protein
MLTVKDNFQNIRNDLAKNDIVIDAQESVVRGRTASSFPLHAIIIPDECSTQPLWQPKQLNNKEFVAVP